MTAADFLAGLWAIRWIIIVSAIMFGTAYLTVRSSNRKGTR